MKENYKISVNVEKNQELICRIENSVINLYDKFMFLECYS